MNSFIQSLCDYNLWADNKILTALEEHEENINQRVIDLYSHILNAQIFWYSRVMKKEITINVWDTYPLSEFRSLHEDNLKHIKFIMANYDLDERINYQSTPGETYINSIRDILFHLFNHGIHHRGQINSELKKLGIEPPAIDYIYFRRN